MRMVFVIAVAAATALSAPAFAQTAGAPGAIGAVGGLTGSNTPGSGVSPNGYYGPQSYGRGSGYYDNGYSAEASQPSWSVNYNREGFNPTWSDEPHPVGRGDYDNGYSGESSQPSGPSTTTERAPTAPHGDAESGQPVVTCGVE